MPETLRIANQTLVDRLAESPPPPPPLPSREASRGERPTEGNRVCQRCPRLAASATALRGEPRRKADGGQPCISALSSVATIRSMLRVHLARVSCRSAAVPGVLDGDPTTPSVSATGICL